MENGIKTKRSIVIEKLLSIGYSLESILDYETEYMETLLSDYEFKKNEEIKYGNN